MELRANTGEGTGRTLMGFYYKQRGNRQRVNLTKPERRDNSLQEILTSTEVSELGRYMTIGASVNVRTTQNKLVEWREGERIELEFDEFRS